MNNEWISVKDRLPELCIKSNFGLSSKPVLCRHKDNHHEDCILNESEEDSYPPYWTYVQDGEYTELVTHWMPLPEPPKQ